MQSNESNELRFLRLPAVLARVPFSRSRLYDLVREGQFPRPIAIGRRAVAWRSDEVHSWIEARIAESRGGES